MKSTPSLFIAAIATATLYPVIAFGTSTSLQFVPISDVGGSAILAKGVLPLSAGTVAVYGSEPLSPCYMGIYVVGGELCSQAQAPLLAILNASGSQSTSMPAAALGSGNSTIVSAAMDASGNIWITGETDSDDFPLVSALFTQKTAYHLTGFIAKLDPNLNILFSTFLGGQTVPTLAQTTPAAIALDSAGNAYITGNTNDASFPVTGPTFAPATIPNLTVSFLAKITSDGSKLLFSRTFGGTMSPCVGGSSCIGYAAYTNASAIAIDAAGNATVAGQTYSTNFPVTANVSNTNGGAFVSRISADGSTLIWSTEVGIAPYNGVTNAPSSVQAIALDSGDNVYIAGSSSSAVATTPGALQSTYQTIPGYTPGGFVVKLSSDASQLLFATNLSGMRGATLSGLALDAKTNVWVTGHTNSPDFPGLHATLATGLDFALELNANATALQQIFSLVPQTVTQPPAFDSNGNLMLLASPGNLLRLNAATASSVPAVFALTNAAIPQAAANIAPAEIMTIYGVGLGPSTEIIAAPNSNGVYPTQLGGVSVQIGGNGSPVAAPLLYVGPNQINFEVTGALANPIIGPSTVTVVTPIGPLPVMALNVAGSIGVFGVLNADGSVNSSTNPAKEGSIVSLYLTGLGLAGYTSQDGAIVPSANSAFMNFVEVNWNLGTVPLPLLYAGNAPGEIDGLDQINVQLPAATQNPLLTVVVPVIYNDKLPATSNTVIVYAQ